MKNLIHLVATLLIPCAEANVTLPYSFSPGQVIQSSQVNADFGSLRDELNTFENTTGSYSNFGTDTGIANAYVIALSTALLNYTAGLSISFVAQHSNTGASTINVNSLGVVNLTGPGGTTLLASDIVIGQIVSAEYDGIQFQLISQQGSASSSNSNLTLVKRDASGSINSASANITALTASTANIAGQITASNLTASQAVFTDSSKNLVSNAVTGTGNVVMSASPTLTGTLAGASQTLSGTLSVTGNTGHGTSASGAAGQLLTESTNQTNAGYTMNNFSSNSTVNSSGAYRTTGLLWTTTPVISSGINNTDRTTGLDAEALRTSASDVGSMTQGISNSSVGLQAIRALYGHSGSTGTTTSTAGIYTALFAGGGTISNAYGVLVGSAGQTGATISNEAGVAIQTRSGTNSSELLLGTSTVPSGTFGIYQSDSSANQFAGITTFSNTTDSTTTSTGAIIDSGGLAVAKASNFGGVLTERIDQNANTQAIISNQTSGTSANAKLTVKANSSSGYLGAFDTANTDVTAFADKVVLDTNSDASGLEISTGTAGQTIEFRSGARALAATVDSSQDWTFKNQVSSGTADSQSVFTASSLGGLSTAIIYGYTANMTTTSTQTSAATGFRSDISTGANISLVANFDSSPPVVNSGTITNYVGLYDTGAATHRATNNVAVADASNITGNWFIAQTGTDASKLGGALTVGGDLTAGGSHSSIAGAAFLKLQGAATSVSGYGADAGHQNGGTQTYSIGTGVNGLMVADDLSSGVAALFFLTNDGSTVTIISDPASAFSVSANTANKWSVTSTGGTVTIRNNFNTAARSLSVTWIRTG